MAGPAVLVEGLSTLPSDRGPGPVIPGSTWEGGVRAVVEALTPSCERGSTPPGHEVLLVLPKGAELEGEVAFAGATDEGLGLLPLALGPPPRGLPYLLMGGGKNRGLGFVRFASPPWRVGGPGNARRHPQRARLRAGR